MKIAIIGAGATGLTAGYELCKGGHEVTVLEAADKLAGLTCVRSVGETDLEYIYHHIFTSDTYLTDLAEELGLKMIWAEPSNGFYTDGKLYPFTSPMDLLRFKPLPFWARVSMGLMVLKSRYVKDFEALENMTAGEWITKMAGAAVYEKVWKPLIYSKFDIDAENVAAVWIWNKFKLRGGTRGKGNAKEMLGYMERSFGELYKALAANLDVRLNCAVREIKRADDGVLVNGEKFDRVLFTGAPALLAEICREIDGEYLEKIRQLRYKANICVTLQLKRPLSKFYWTTVADERLPFVAAIEHTNIMDKELYGGENIVYLTRYLDSGDELYGASDDEIVSKFCEGLAGMYEGFTAEDVTDAVVYRSLYSQPVVGLRYSEIIPEFATPVEGIYLSSMAQVYPEDRGQNYAIRAGREISKLMMEGEA